MNSEVWRAVVIVVVVVVLSAANVAGVRTSTAITNVLTVGKVFPLFLLALAGFFFVDPQRYSFAAAPPYGAFSTATLLAMFAFAGFESALIPTGEMRDPQRHVPFSLLAGMSVVAALYSCVQAVCVGLVPDLAHANRPLSDAAGHIIGRAGESAVAAAALISIAGVMNAIVFATPRILFAMAENGELPRVFSSTHTRFRTPVAAIIATTTLGGLVALFSTFVSALTISTIVRLVVYMATCAALPVLRRRTELPRPSFSAPAGPLISAGAIALGLWLISNSPWAEVRVAAIFAVVGVALYFVGSRETRAVHRGGVIISRFRLTWSCSDESNSWLRRSDRLILGATASSAQVQPPPAPWRGAGSTPCVGSDGGVYKCPPAPRTIAVRAGRLFDSNDGPDADETSRARNGRSHHRGRCRRRR